MTAPLIFPYRCEFKVLDTTAQTQDDDYREAAPRKEADDAVEVLAQIEPKSFKRLSMWEAGRDLDQAAFVVVHRRELERRGMVDDHGEPTTPKIGDRLYQIKSRFGGVVTVVRNPPGAYVTGVMPLSYGPGGVNAIYEVRLEPRGPTG